MDLFGSQLIMASVNLMELLLKISQLTMDFLIMKFYFCLKTQKIVFGCLGLMETLALFKMKNFLISIMCDF